MLISGPTHDLTVVTQLEINKYFKNVAHEYMILICEDGFVQEGASLFFFFFGPATGLKSTLASPPRKKIPYM